MPTPIIEDWKSYGGFLRGRTFPSPRGLQVVHSDSPEPVTQDTNDFPEWGWHEIDNTGVQTRTDWNYFNNPDLVPMIADMRNYFNGRTATDEGLLCEFRIKDSTLGENVTLTLEGYFENQSNFKFRPYRRVYSDGYPGVYTKLSLHPNNYATVLFNENATGVKVLAGYFERNDVQYIGIGLVSNERNFWQISSRLFYANEASYERLFGNGVPWHSTGDPNIDDDPASPTDGIPIGDRRRGGWGTRNTRSDNIGLPTLPTLVATSAGFVTLYSVTDGILKQLASELYTNNWVQALQNYFSSANDIIAGLSIVPFQPALGSRAKPKIGLTTLDVAMTKIADQYKEIDCGTVDVEEYYGSCFDYAPYTKIAIYLPYVGMRTLDTDDLMGKKVGVKYYCDCYSGSCMAVIYTLVDSEPCVRYCFNGNVAQQVPTAGASWDNMIRSALTLTAVAIPAIGAGVMAAGSAGGAAAQTLGAGSTMGSAAINARNTFNTSWVNSGNLVDSKALDGSAMATGMSAKPAVTRSGSLGSGVGFLGPQKPFLVVTRPRQSIPTDYITFHGYPSNEFAKLAALSGYVEVEEIRLTGIYATGPEKDEIQRLLKEGVYL